MRARNSIFICETGCCENKLAKKTHDNKKHYRRKFLKLFFYIFLQFSRYIYFRFEIKKTTPVHLIGHHSRLSTISVNDTALDDDCEMSLKEFSIEKEKTQMNSEKRWTFHSRGIPERTKQAARALKTETRWWTRRYGYDEGRRRRTSLWVTSTYPVSPQVAGPWCSDTSVQAGNCIVGLVGRVLLIRTVEEIRESPDLRRKTWSNFETCTKQCLKSVKSYQILHRGIRQAEVARTFADRNRDEKVLETCIAVDAFEIKWTSRIKRNRDGE